MKKVCILGMGYIGCPMACVLADKGYEVFGVDIKKEIIDSLKNGKAHISEPNLEALLRKSINRKKLKVGYEPVPSDIFIIAVPTPIIRKNSNEHFKIPSPDISFVLKAFKSILPILNPGNLIILESTSPVGTTKKLFNIFIKDNAEFKEDIFMAYSPERVIPGKILFELTNNDRVVGGINPASTEIAASFYMSFVDGKVLKTNDRTAEMVKLTENSYRDVNIAFANELSIINEELDIDTKELISLANHHPRVQILNPGIGVGGHCIPVDPWFIVNESNGKAKIIELARRINDYKPIWIVQKILKKNKEFFEENKKKPVIACLGLSYKPNVDDFRESPALFIVNKLIQNGLNILVVEPHMKKNNNFELVNLKMAKQKSDLFVLLVKHKEFEEFEVSDDLKFV